MMFLSKERVLDDHKRFAKDMRENYNVEDCQVYESGASTIYNGEQYSAVFLGFVIELNDNVYEVTKPFAQDESGDLASLRDAFHLFENGKFKNRQPGFSPRGIRSHWHEEESE